MEDRDISFNETPATGTSDDAFNGPHHQTRPNLHLELPPPPASPIYSPPPAPLAIGLLPASHLSPIIDPIPIDPSLVNLSLNKDLVSDSSKKIHQASVQPNSVGYFNPITQENSDSTPLTECGGFFFPSSPTITESAPTIHNQLPFPLTRPLIGPTTAEILPEFPPTSFMPRSAPPPVVRESLDMLPLTQPEVSRALPASTSAPIVFTPEPLTAVRPNVPVLPPIVSTPTPPSISVARNEQVLTPTHTPPPNSEDPGISALPLTRPPIQSVPTSAPSTSITTYKRGRGRGAGRGAGRARLKDRSKRHPSPSHEPPRDPGIINDSSDKVLTTIQEVNRVTRSTRNAPSKAIRNPHSEELPITLAGMRSKRTQITKRNPDGTNVELPVKGTRAPVEAAAITTKRRVSGSGQGNPTKRIRQ
ncbi:hypothetical protein BDZ94DRAFT_1272239 [Collybia nuda]|uniref:Uncharacterized protein n=1 Tax=Collybia nuda TaxID=64659 RepID=A0A9P5XVI3_9AGAR|nr:hypothetical protein BDZ94DRAFT_1272239 [Collybia nuda]